MAPRVVPVVVQGGGGSSAGLLLLFVAIVGLVALFSGNLDRWITAIAGSAGGPEGLHRTGTGGNYAPLPAGPWGEVTPPGTGAGSQPSRPSRGAF